MTKAKDYEFLSFFDCVIINQSDLSQSGETLKKTLNPLKSRGEIEVQQNQLFEDQRDSDFETPDGNHGSLFRCPNEGNK